MNLNQFSNHVARLVDTDGTKINVAETKRVLAVAFQELSQMTPAECADIVSKGLASGEKAKAKAKTKKPAKKKKAGRRK